MDKYCDTSKLSIRQIDKPTAKKMVVKYHYSKLWTKCSVALGLFIDTGKEHSFFDEAEEKMIGVIVYGDPIGRLTWQSISDEIKRKEVLELTRLFIHDGYGSNIESWFISQSFNWLRKNKPEIKALISYADPGANHKGIIYRASNWLYQGNDIGMGDAYMYRYPNTNNWLSDRAIGEQLGTNGLRGVLDKIPDMEYKKKLRKHRYLYFLCSKGEKKQLINNLKHPIKEYVWLLWYIQDSNRTN